MLSPTEKLVEDIASVYFGVLGISTKLGVRDRRRGGARRHVASHPAEPPRDRTASGSTRPFRTKLSKKLCAFSRAHRIPTLIQNNRWFHDLLTHGIEVEYPDPASGEMLGDRAYLVDFDNPGENDILVVRQLTVTDPSGKRIRPDLTVFLNGLPIAVIELKAPAAAEASLDVAIDQLARLQGNTVPDMLVTNAALVVSDGLLTRVGAITSNRNRFMPWRPPEGGASTLEALIRGLFAPETLVDYLRNCVLFEEDERGEIAQKDRGLPSVPSGAKDASASVLDRTEVSVGPRATAVPV